ncbi:hypothetical protein LTR08_007652 [Meristemomyces frigidus]|nr:hypothetical protein LTR08_007652 [Meristemomyces frigidus]
MAGIEQIVVHSKSYVIRWIEVPAHHSISWSVEPHKKSINFGIFKHPGTKGGLTPSLPAQESTDSAESLPPTPGLDDLPQAGKRARAGSIGKNAESTAKEKLESIGLKSVAWAGKCEADKVTMGRYEVQEREGGMFGLVFDNTFSRQTSKTVHFVLMTHPTDAPPKSGHHLRYSQAFAAGSSATVGKGYSPSLRPITDSDEHIPKTGLLQPAVLEDPRPASKGGRGVETSYPEGSSFYTGVLQKKRRKKGQGHAKRFFSLDFTSSTLSYYRDRHSSALRGAVPLSLAAVGSNEKTREFSIDSGAEVWHLKASNKRDFDGWQDALERASSSAQTPLTPVPTRSFGGLPKINAPNPAEDREWQRVEQLVSKASGTRDALRGLAKDTDPRYLPGNSGLSLGLTQSGGSGNTPSPTSYDSVNPYFPEVGEQSQDRRPFWKRKPSAEKGTTALFKRSVSAQLAMPSPSSVPMPLSPAGGNLNIPKRPSARGQPASSEEDVHYRCMALLHDLDDVVTEFSALVAESKARRNPPLPTSASRTSIGSIDDQEFFDAEDGGGSPSQLLHIRRQSDDAESREESQLDHGTEADSDTSSDNGDATGESSLFAATSKTTRNRLFPSKPQSVSPLPLAVVQRRTTVRPPKQAPPSIIGFLRKNAGKDLSTVSMPVTANEPTSLLQRLAESMEYSQLLDTAAQPSLPAPERLAYVAAFAISYFANSRVKERAIRKPFNPMLHETFELVREDLGFRFVAEKVSHHPVRLACQAESFANGGWTFAQSPQPIQKFWGKSVELNTEGRARVVLHGVGGGECYSWSQATCFLRNVIAGEKYVEPVQSMVVTCETSGARAVVTFKAGGMFSGRSEDVGVKLFGGGGGEGEVLDVGLVGKWTEGLQRTDTGATVWTVGALVAEAARVYGFTGFAAGLNEVTAIEEGRLPPSDSRLRPDQLALEAGDSDRAEALKARLEERQRARRKFGEEQGARAGEGFFFERVEGGGGEDAWSLREGAGGYWERRERGDWEGVGQVFEV